MNPEDVGRILDEIGERIGPAGQYAWQVLVNGERVLGAVYAVVALGSLAVAFFLYRACRWAIRKHAEGDSYDSYDLAAIALGTGSLLALVACVGFLVSAIPSLFMPEYVVLREVIGGVR